MEEDFYIDYASLDDFQRQLIDRSTEQNMVVTGTAGSGKSLIALHKAKKIANDGDSYMVIVFTKSLRKYFEDGMKSLGLRNVYHYHQWKHNQRNVKYLIVDECQDFSSEEIDEMRQFGQYCLFFGDSAQSIMDFRKETQKVETTAYKLDVTLDNLYFNYRLTVEVALLAEKVGNVRGLSGKCKRHGEKPSLLKEPSFDEQLDKIAEIIKNRSLTNVGILLPFNTMIKGNSSHDGRSNLSVEYVKGYLLRKGVTCEFKYEDLKETEMDLNFHSTNPKIMTWWCAKGLQFKDVFVPGCENLYESERQSALYVAMTRCSERLYIGYSGSLNSFFPSNTSSFCKENDFEEL